MLTLSGKGAGSARKLTLYTEWRTSGFPCCPESSLRRIPPSDTEREREPFRGKNESISGQDTQHKDEGYCDVSSFQLGQRSSLSEKGGKNSSAEKNFQARWPHKRVCSCQRAQQAVTNYLYIS